MLAKSARGVNLHLLLQLTQIQALPCFAYTTARSRDNVVQAGGHGGISRLYGRTRDLRIVVFTNVELKSTSRCSKALNPAENPSIRKFVNPKIVWCHRRDSNPHTLAG